MFTIAKVADMIGVPAATLRAWERRYSIVSPHRTESGYRRYGQRDVNALVQMNSLIQSGWAPKEAAVEVLRSQVETAEQHVVNGSTVSTLQEQDFSITRVVQATFGQISEARTEHNGLLYPHLIDDFVDAAARIDQCRAEQIVDEVIPSAKFETVVDRWMMPTLQRLGDDWFKGAISIAGEHMVVNVLARRLSLAYEAAGTNPDGPRIVLGLPQGSLHELGLLAFATAIRRLGMNTTYLGSDLPITEWRSVVKWHNPAAVVLALPRIEDVQGLHDIVDSLTSLNPSILIAVGGKNQDRAPEECRRLGHNIGDAAMSLHESMRAR